MNWQIYPINVFEDHKKDWNSLNTSNGNTPLLDSRFVLPLIKHFGTRKEKFAVCTENGAVCCMTIVGKTKFGVWETFQPSQAPIGVWVQDATVSTETLGNTLRRVLPGALFVFGITQQDPDLLPRPEHTACTNTIDYISTARVTVAGSFDEYWAKRGKNLRQNLRRQRNKLGRENLTAKLITINDAAAMSSAIEKYGALESAGWKSKSNTAIHINNSQGKFYLEMLQNFSATGQALVFQYYYNDDLSATDLCIIGGGSLIILKTTYDESIKTTSPAMLMREDAFNYVFSEQLVQRIEFYGKVMEWHNRWAEDIRVMFHTNFYSGFGAVVGKIRRTKFSAQNMA